MKALNLTTAAKLGLVLLTAFLLTTSTFAFGFESGGKKLSSEAKLNLVEGIKSSNYGVKRASIFLVASYEIKEAIDVLKDELEHETDPRISVLINLALYKLGESVDTNDVYDYALIDWNEKVQYMSNEIVNTYKNQKDAVASYNGD